MQLFINQYFYSIHCFFVLSHTQIGIISTMTLKYHFEDTETMPDERRIINFNHIKNCTIKSVKGVWDFMFTFFAFSSLHGFAYITMEGRHRIEKFAWALFVGMALYGAVSLGLQTWRRFQENPTVVSMERNYKDWNTSFPSIAICPLEKYSEENLKKVIEELDYVKDKQTLRTFLKELAEATYGTFDQVKIEFNQLKPKDYWLAVSRIRFAFTYKVSNSNPESYNVFRLNAFMSELGVCYSYNSDATHYNDPLYWEQERWTSLGTFPVFESSPLDGDIFAQMRNMNSGYKMYIYGPSEFPDIAMPFLSAKVNTYKTLDLTALSIVSSEAARELNVGQRRCRLQHESTLQISPIYSYNLCRQECRMMESHRLCGCVPYFYRPIGKYPICNTKGMQCLDKHTDQLTKLIDPSSGRKVKCQCYPLCNEVNYFVDADNTMVWSLGTNLKIGLIKYPKFRLKRDIIFGPADLLVSIGGTAGLFLGCSILSLFEVVYFFFLRPMYYWKYNIPLAYTRP